MNKIPTWVWLAVLAGGGYVLYQFFKKEGQKLVVDPLATLIAAPIIATENFFHQTPQTTGSIVLPNGSLVPTYTVQAYIDNATGQTRVQYQGHVYSLSPHNADGNFPAALVS